MKRKIIKQGVDTYTISLPKKWIITNQIKKGDELNIEELAGKLIISYDGVLKSSNGVFVKLDDSFNKEVIKKFILAIYKSGVDEIDMKLKNEVKDTVQEILKNEIMGYEIVEDRDGFVKIKDIANHQEDINQFIQRTFYIIKECMNMPITREEIKDKNLLIKRLINFSIRSLNKKPYLDRFYLEYMYSTLNYLDETRAVIWYIAKETSKETFQRNKSITDKIVNMFDLAFHNYLAYSDEKSSQIMVMRRDLFEEINKVNELDSVKFLARLSVLINNISSFTENIISYRFYKKYVTEKEKEIMN